MNSISKPLTWLDTRQDYDSLWRRGALVTNADGTQIGHPGPLVSDSTYYRAAVPLYKGQFYGAKFVAILGVVGTGAGTIFYVEEHDFKDTWQEVPVSAAQSILIDSPPVVPPITEEAFVDTASGAFKLVDVAIQQSNLANQEDAKRFLYAENVGLWALIDKARIELQLLEAFRVVSAKEAEKLMSEVIVPLTAAANDANAIYSAHENSNWISFFDYITQVAKMTALTFTDLGDARMRRIAEVYGTIVKHNRSEAALIAKLSAQDGTTALVERLQSGLVRTQLAQTQIESKLRELGIDLAAFRQSQGLQGLPAVLITVVGVKITLSFVLATLKFIVLFIIQNQIVNALIDAFFAKTEALGIAEAESRLVILPSESARLLERGKILSQSRTQTLDTLKALADLLPSQPDIEAKAEVIESQVRPKWPLYIFAGILSAVTIFVWKKLRT